MLEVLITFLVSICIGGSGLCQIETSTSEFHCSRDGITIKDSSLVFCGQIYEGTDIAVEEMLNANLDIDSIAVSSPGGFGFAALKLASIVQDRNLQLTVFDECLSACAHFLFFPDRSVIVQEDTIVAFHHTATAHVRFSEANPSIADRLSPEAFKMAELEQAFYASRGLSPEFLVLPLTMLDPTCIEPVESPNKFFMKAKWQMWTADRETMTDLRGAPINGWWTEGRYPFWSLVEKRYPHLKSPMVFKFYVHQMDDLTAAPPELPACAHQ